jgi:hypothetical protein
MIQVNNSQGEEPEIPINRATKRDCELEIETLQKAPTDEANLRDDIDGRFLIGIIY